MRWLPEEQRPVGLSLTRQPVEDPAPVSPSPGRPLAEEAAPVNPSPTSPPAEETGPLDSGVIRGPLEGQLPEQADVPDVGRVAAETATTEIESAPAPPQPEAASRAPEGLGTDELTPTRAEAAVRAYCRVLCVPAEFEQAVVETIAAFEDAGRSSTPGEVRLLSITRTIGAAHASGSRGQPDRGDRSSPEGREPDCESTPVRLGARANDELDPSERCALEKHLDGCLLCQATQLKMERAERAFATLVVADPTVQQ